MLADTRHGSGVQSYVSSVCPNSSGISVMGYAGHHKRTRRAFVSYHQDVPVLLRAACKHRLRSEMSIDDADSSLCWIWSGTHTLQDPSHVASVPSF